MITIRNCNYEVKVNVNVKVRKIPRTSHRSPFS